MEQNYQNHHRIVPGFHRVLLVFLVAGLIGSTINLYRSWNNDNIYSASLILLLFISASLMYAYIRVFPLKAQDRAIRAEENFRYYLLTGNALPADLRIEQIVALRFASDEEFPELTLRALKENLSSKAIKQEIKHWRADCHRV